MFAGRQGDRHTFDTLYAELDRRYPGDVSAILTIRYAVRWMQ